MRDPNSVLISLILKGNERKLGKALKRGADVNKLDEFGRPPLMNAILAERADVNIIKMLVENGANVNIKDSGQKWTALHFAAREGHADIVEFLIESGAEIDPQDVFGNTPLWRAVFTFKGDPKIINILLSHGADKYRKNYSDISPVDLANTIGDQEILKLLSET